MTLLDDRRTTVRTRRSTIGVDGSSAGAARAESGASAGRRPRRAAQPAPTQPAGALSGLSDVPFIVPIVLLVIGALGLTLYLSTKAAQDSYSLESLRQSNRELTEKRDSFKHTADAGDSAAELARKASELGMIQGSPAPQLVVGADGKARLKGRLVPAEGSTLPPLNPTPDPAEEIDASKVDDSGGLDGNPAPSSDQPTDAGPAESAEAGDTPPPALTTPPAGQAPAPNVLPPGAATPGANPRRSR
ncbi:hypothetical protein C6V83_12785 [Gordonia iterans]|uniref:Cell division protein FtsL n=1 Tax=Gordonia iterans TaxID=1004901 RepID=A0A2S0KH42_9ACTN|nr:hypothetical protein [Gordonia iterans]AVM00999.1 hypothetical protein C6V83_12785 [Gordonia iterans]